MPRPRTRQRRGPKCIVTSSLLEDDVTVAPADDEREEAAKEGRGIPPTFGPAGSGSLDVGGPFVVTSGVSSGSGSGSGATTGEVGSCGSDSGAIAVGSHAPSGIATAGLRPLPIHCACRNATSSDFAAGRTFSAYSFASMPFGNSTR